MNKNKTKIFFDSDANLNIIKQKKVGIIGYGNQGRAQALNLKESGLEVRVGLRKNSKSKQRVENNQLNWMEIKDATKWANLISIMLPDKIAPKVFKNDILDNLNSGDTLLFSHGYNIHYKVIQPPKFINVIMAAPSGAGTELRKRYIDGCGIPGLFAVHQDHSGNAEKMVLAYCRAIGITKSGVVKSTFREETETDLFGEQILLTGGIPRMIQLSYKVLLDAGYSPSVSWLVCYYELKTIVDMFHSKGFEFMHAAISDTAEYGGITRGRSIIGEHVESEMQKALEEIQSGEFHSEWMKEHNYGYPLLDKLRKEERELGIEKISQYMLKKLFSDK